MRRCEVQGLCPRALARGTITRFGREESRRVLQLPARSGGSVMRHHDATRCAWGLRNASLRALHPRHGANFFPSQLGPRLPQQIRAAALLRARARRGGAGAHSHPQRSGVGGASHPRDRRTVAAIAESMALARLLSPAILVIEDVDRIAPSRRPGDIRARPRHASAERGGPRRRPARAALRRRQPQREAARRSGGCSVTPRAVHPSGRGGRTRIRLALPHVPRLPRFVPASPNRRADDSVLSTTRNYSTTTASPTGFEPVLQP